MRQAVLSLLILIALLASVAAAPLQGGTPPPQPTPTPNLLVTCLDEGLGTCLAQFFQRG